jgi:hypothetical protein
MKPIAWYDPTNGMVSTDNDCPLFTPLGQIWGLYPKEEWVGLTDEEIWETISRIGTSDSDVNPYAKLADARAIEAKLKEKNT